MNKEYLLTYRDSNTGFEFEWFDTEEEMLDRVEELGNTIFDIEALRIKVIDKII